MKLTRPTDLKNILKKRIDDLNNVELLETILDFISNIDSNEIYDVSEEQEKAIKEELEDIKNRNVISNELTNKEIDEWLRKSLK